MKIRDRLMLYITVGVLAFIGIVLFGEYLVIVYERIKQGKLSELNLMLLLSCKMP